MATGADRPGPRRSPWPCSHDRPGSFNEDARRASHEELAVAKLLVAEGHHVRTLAERRGGRTPDLLACGVTVEVKAFLSLAERGGRPPQAEKVANKLLDASGQGTVVVIWGPTSGLSQPVARAGFTLFQDKAKTEGLKMARQARIIGKDFDLTLAPSAVLNRRPSPPALGA